MKQIPPPEGRSRTAPPRALIFDSVFDQYRGVVAFVRVVDGVFRKGEAIQRDADRHARGDRRDRVPARPTW